MKVFNFVIKAAMIGSLFAATLAGQSRDQNYPTSVETSEISGTIKARDIGDSRLTSYFYAFDGAQGDVFVNVVTRNFTGDIDVFTRDALRPLTKMVIFGNAGQQQETGRVIYLRKPERLILRIQGRTPNDEPASYQIKFAGSFVAVNERPAVDEPTITRNEASAGSAVNSVGTIVAVAPKPTPAPPAERAPLPTTETKPVAPGTRTTAKTAAAKPSLPSAESVKKAEVVVKSAVKEPAEVRTLLGDRSGSRARTTPPAKKTPPVKAPPAPDPLASINLKIELKAGGEVLRPLNDVLRFTVDKGVLTVIMKTGATTRYSMVTEVSRVTIE